MMAECRVLVLTVALAASAMSSNGSTPLDGAEQVHDQLQHVAAARSIVHPGTPLEAAVVTLARVSGVAIGFESVDNRTDVVALARPFDLRGLSPERAIAQLLGTKTSYYWRESHGALVVRPAAAGGGTLRTFLDEPAPDLPLTDVTLSDALVRVIEAYTRPRYALPAARPAATTPQAKHRFSVASSRPSTFADLLTRIVVAHGSAGWMVTYHAFDGNTGKANPTIAFFTFDGSQFGQGLPRSIMTF